MIGLPYFDAHCDTITAALSMSPAMTFMASISSMKFSMLVKPFLLKERK